jgi:cell division transport system permease protein
MFILPLMAILLGIEFYLVFERTTVNYKKSLKEGYTMLVVSKAATQLDVLQSLNAHVDTLEAINREEVIDEVTKDVNKNSSKEILAALPYFYNVGLDAYLKVEKLEGIKKDLEADENIKKVEIFGSSYNSSYNLFIFIELLIKVFILFMAVVSLFLVIKQMEIWKYAHKERMQVMEIFGAPLMLRSGILFKVAFIDAIWASVFVSAIFLYAKFSWAARSGIDMVSSNKDALFSVLDIFLLVVVAVLIVVIAVFSVVFNTKGDQE